MIESSALDALMLLARDGDGKAMGRLLTELSPKLRGFIRRQLFHSGRTDPADNEDLLQVTLLAIHAKQHTYDPAQSLGGWVYAIARYKVVDYLRATRHYQEDVPIDQADQLAASDDHEAAEANLDLSVVLGHLPARTRALIRATKIDRMGMAEVAHRAGMSEAAVKVAVHRGLERLTEVFGKPRSP